MKSYKEKTVRPSYSKKIAVKPIFEICGNWVFLSTRWQCGSIAATVAVDLRDLIALKMPFLTHESTDCEKPWFHQKCMALFGVGVQILCNNCNVF